MAQAHTIERRLHAAHPPFAIGSLGRGLHSVYFEQCGNPQGAPVLFVHGGPGAATIAEHRRLFDPEAFNAVLFDQRGCGRSGPHGETRENDTAALIADMEELRQRLGIERWLLFGGSWGSTLSLAYAIAHPQHVTGLILRGIFLGTRTEVDWFLHDMGRFFPHEHEAFTSFLEADERGDILASYHRRLMDDNAKIHQPAAEQWASYETSCSTLFARTRRVTGPFALAMARLEAHYFVNDCFLPPDHIMEGIGRIKHLPARIIQGRHDVICPPRTAQRLADAWGPAARISIIDDAGHSTFESGITNALLAALEEFTAH